MRRLTMKKTLAFLFAALVMMALLPARAVEAPYAGYTSNAYGEPVPAPVGYQPTWLYDGHDLGTGPLNKPQELFYDKARKELYIADTGASRVVVVDHALAFVREYTMAGEVPLVSPTGIFVTAKGEIFIADEGAGSVLCMSLDGELLRRYDRPQSELYGDDTPYRPQKVVVDSAGRVYVLSAGVYQGLLCFYEDGSFLNFFGASHVDVTAKMVLQKLWRSVMTREQREATESFVPIEYANITIDEEDMVYAVVTVSETASSRAIVKLNPMGINILPVFTFGSTFALADALSEHNSLLTVLDKNSRRVLQFGEHTNGIVLHFGGFGNQLGLFRTPVSMEDMEGDILILDSETGAITRFVKTEFGRAIHQATAQYGQGLYTESIALWERVLEMNNNFAMAHRGLGRAYFQLEDYEKAMASFKLANDKEGYSMAFKEQSLIWIRGNIAWFFLGALLVFVLFQVRKRKKRKDWAAGITRENRNRFFPIRAMFHPYAAFDEVKSDGAGSARTGLLLVFLFFVSAVITYVGTGFIFNANRLERLNVLLVFAGTVGGFVLVYGANLAVSSLMDDCEGKPPELFIVLSHSLLPVIITQVAAALASNFVSQEVGIFLQMLRTIGVLWAVIMFFTGQFQVNRLTFKRTLLNLFLTVVTLVIILVLMILLYSLLQQIWVFVVTLYNEIMFRI